MARADVAAPRPPRWRRALPALATLAVILGLASYLYDQRAHIASTWTLHPSDCARIGALVLASLWLRAWANRAFFGRLGVEASLRDWFGVVSVTSFTNYLPLSAGLLAKGFFLNRVHRLPYRTFAIGQVGLLLLILGANGGMGLGALLGGLPPGGRAPLALAFAGMIAASALVWLPRAPAPWLRFVPFEHLPAVRRAAPAVIALQAGVLLSTAYSLRLAFDMGEARVPLAACVVFGAAVVVTRVVSITPGALGIREFLVGALAWTTGYDLADAVIAATVVRAVELVVVLAVGGFYTYALSRQVVSTYDS